uniref:NADH-ubiquinone oxidoreductase chain 5 n=1 Tax=Balamuthia mandrillaris TaxID=66527 RepID=A0A0K1HRJ2_9EUKA|nr:NADH dehydrogenase subunit 5 [Balamuthia mandrillaris]AKT94905.1 NADH dehydrogenase subunit 5 [Balamuthia mandrillaris]
MYLISIFGCLFNIFFLVLFGRLLPKNILFRFVLLSLFLSLSSSFLIFYEVIILKTVCIVPLGTWIQASFFKVTWSLLFDSVSVTLLCIVLFISFLVHLYSLEYMSEDPHIIRFIFSLSLFTFFMLVMATANNGLQLFLGWEGVGLASYLLINFWYSRSEANKSAIKAIVVNRIGDFGLYFGILLMLFVFKSTNFGTIFATCHLYESTCFNIFGYEIGVLPLIASCIFLGTMGKSAQLGLHMWLPDAMEGPTPVSALLHAATMVTAGVFVLIRFSILFEHAPVVLFFVTLVGSATTLFAGISAVMQTDVKKIIAYSTCSHLGIMLLICGFSQYNAALFHLLNHAFFKALLFLGAGSIIHAVADEQDSRKMGGLVALMPLTYMSFFVGSLSLIGFPFLSGYFSKDLIWEIIFSNYYSFAFLDSVDIWFAGNGAFVFFYYKYMFFVFNIILVLSVVYSFRLLFIVFPFTYNGFKSNLLNVHEPSLFMFLPLVVLSFLSIFAGYFFKDMYVGLGLTNWQSSLPSPVVSNAAFRELLFASGIASWPTFFLKLFTFFLALFFIFVLYVFYSNTLQSRSLLYSSYKVLCWYVNKLFLSPVLFIFYCLCWVYNRFFKNDWVSCSMFVVMCVFFSGLGVAYFFPSIFLGFIVCFVIYTLLFALPGVAGTSDLLAYFLVLGNQKRFYKFVSFVLAEDHALYRWLSKVVLFASHHITFKSIDRGFIEFFGPFGIVNTLRAWSKKVGLGWNTHFFSYVFVTLFVASLVVLYLVVFATFDDIILLLFVFFLFCFLVDTKTGD